MFIGGAKRSTISGPIFKWKVMENSFFKISSSTNIVSTKVVFLAAKIRFFLTVFLNWLNFTLQKFFFVAAPFNHKNRIYE